MRSRFLPCLFALLIPCTAQAQIMTDPAQDMPVYEAPAGEPENIITPGEGEAIDEAPPIGEKLPAPEKAAAPSKTEAAPPRAEKAQELNVVRLQGLNKVTARISTLEAPLGIVMRFGNLEIIAKRCWKSPPEEQPENASFLEIRELKPGEGPQTIFNGWMFSSSPALSGLEHPVYDVTVLSCEYVAEPEE